MKRMVLMLLALSLWATVGATMLFGAGAEEKAAGEAAARAAVPGTDIVKVAGRYTVKESWLETPTASQLGITEFNEAPMLAALVQQGLLPPVDQRHRSGGWPSLRTRPMGPVGVDHFPTAAAATMDLGGVPEAVHRAVGLVVGLDVEGEDGGVVE